MAKTTERYDRNTNFLLSSDQRQMLDKLAALAQSEMAPVLRRLIVASYEHQIGGHPRCASCEPCRCPQFFAPPQLPTGPTDAAG